MGRDFEGPRGSIGEKDGENGVVGAAGDVGEEFAADWLRDSWYFDDAGGRMTGVANCGGKGRNFVSLQILQYSCESSSIIIVLIGSVHI